MAKKAFKGFNKDLSVEGFSMRRVRSLKQRGRSAVRRAFMLVSIRWTVLLITIQLTVFSMR